MFAIIREYQLDIMLLLCGACAIMAFMLFITRFLSESRRRALIFMELVALFLLWFDRLAYIYAGVPGRKAYIMVRVSNFLVFFLTSAVVFGFNMYLIDWLTHEGKMKTIPRRLTAVGIVSSLGMLLAVISAFTGLYYYFDEANKYHRGQGFLIAYIIPVICPILQYTVIRQYRKVFSRMIFLSLVLYIFVPIVCGIIQIFTYGISIVNMAMVAVSVSLYIFTYLDINNEVERAHEIEIQNMQGEQIKMHRLFDQIANAFVSAVENKDDFTKGNSARVAEFARRIAKMSGKSDEECDKAYYAALLHDVGMIGVPDSVIKNEGDPSKWDYEAIRKKPVIGGEILSSITEYPFLSQAARYSHERYNGTGYPEGLKGEEIPEIARIVGVADAYVTMTTRKRYRDARPDFLAREAFIEGAGDKFDPVFADHMVKIIDSGVNEGITNIPEEIETELTCGTYRDNITTGIVMDETVRRISFASTPDKGAQKDFSAPSILLFDSYDRRVHGDEKAIREYNYLEFGEIWFDDHMITTAARKMEVTKLTRADTDSASDENDKKEYEIIAGRYEDHIILDMKGPQFSKQIIIVLPDKTKSAYIGITGEHCRISDISAQTTDVRLSESDIPRIAKEISYIDHMESDIKNVQIDQTRSASTEGIELINRLNIVFHSMSLPGSNLVWHCPYIIVFSSDDGLVGGENYREYTLVKTDGENDEDKEYSHTDIIMKRTGDFPGWEKWKELNREGIECDVYIEKKKEHVYIRTVNLGISIESDTTIFEEPEKIYVALSGDQVALTDIRII